MDNILLNFICSLNTIILGHCRSLKSIIIFPEFALNYAWQIVVPKLRRDEVCGCRQLYIDSRGCTVRLSLFTLSCALGRRCPCKLPKINLGMWLFIFYTVCKVERNGLCYYCNGIVGFRGGAEGAVAPPFFRVFSKCFWNVDVTLGSYHLARNSGNFGLKSNGKVIFRKFRSEIVEYLQRYSSFSRLGTERRKFPYHLLNFPVSSLSSAENNYGKSKCKW